MIIDQIFDFAFELKDAFRPVAQCHERGGEQFLGGRAGGVLSKPLDGFVGG